MRISESGGERNPTHQLQERLDQQAVIAELGLKALSSTGLEELLDEAVGRAAATLQVDCCNLYELRPDEGKLTLRACAGWTDDKPFNASVTAGRESQAGYTLNVGEPVIVPELANEERFSPSPLLLEHGVVSGLTVVVRQPSKVFGVLAAHDIVPREWEVHDVHFLQSVANIIGEVVERREAEEAQAHLAAIVETSYDAVFRKTLDGTITSWNAAAERMYGYRPEEVIGQKVTLLFPPELEHTFDEIMNRVKNEQQAGVWETVRVRKDGSRIPISLTVSPILDRRGNIIAASTIAHDISDRKRAEADLWQAHNELETRVEERTRELNAVIEELESFAYAVSHDLRAPLRGVNGFARALEEDYGAEMDSEAKHYVSRISAGTRRMSTLIDDLLNLSRLAHRPLKAQPVDLSAIARRTAAELHERDPQRQVDFQITDGLRVDGDEHLLAIALTNLIHNAWKYSEGEEHARVIVGANGTGSETVYFVADNGIGFDMQYSDRLFMPFQRLHSDEVEGTGIGLATVQRVIRRHGGNVWARSEPGDGATFYFTLGKGDRERETTKTTRV